MSESVKRESVKPRRSYRSSLRQRQAERTRTAILDAAARHLEREGYSGSTLRQIAESAGVSVETVYATFGSKAALFAAVGGRNLQAGIGMAVPGGDLRALIAGDDLEAQLTTFGQAAPAIMGPNWAIMDALRTGGATDAELAAAYRTGSGGRRGWMRGFAESWAALGHLRPDLDVDAATDVLWAISAPDLYRLLVVEAGWDADRYAAWLTDAARALVLR
jgi:AcrR family transcriptional regulator